MSTASTPPTHRVGPRISRISSRHWEADYQIIIPKSGKPYRRSMPSARFLDVEKEAEKIQKSGVASVVVMVAGVLDQNMYEGRDLLPKGTFVMLSRRIPVDSFVNAMRGRPQFNSQSSLTNAVGLATDFNFASIKSVYIREDRMGQ